jgi:transposase InsO family protein
MANRTNSRFPTLPPAAFSGSVKNIKHLRIKPRRPQTNGKVERFIQTLLREWAYRFSYSSSAERKHWLAPYLHFYNFHRAHSALSYNAPISRLDRKNLLRRNS